MQLMSHIDLFLQVLPQTDPNLMDLKLQCLLHCVSSLHVCNWTRDPPNYWQSIQHSLSEDDIAHYVSEIIGPILIRFL